MGFFQADALPVQDQFGVIDQGHAVAGGEGFGSCSYEVDVGALVEDQSSGLDGIAEVFDAGYAAGAEGGAVHEQGIELDCAFGGEEAAAAGVEGGVVFEDGDGGFYGVGRGASPFEYGVAGFEGLGYAGQVAGGHLRGNGPSSAVDDDGWFGGASEHRDEWAPVKMLDERSWIGSWFEEQVNILPGHAFVLTRGAGDAAG